MLRQHDMDVLRRLDVHFKECSYITGWCFSSSDLSIHAIIKAICAQHKQGSTFQNTSTFSQSPLTASQPEICESSTLFQYSHLYRWFTHIASYNSEQTQHCLMVDETSVRKRFGLPSLSPCQVNSCIL